MHEQRVYPMPHDRLDRRVPGVFSIMLWHGLRSGMWLWAIVGPLLVVLGVVSYFVDVRDSIFSLFMNRDFMVWGGVFGSAGLSFVWLQMRGYLRFKGED
jgi:heme O synthase-like polyprenyltransferase